jgi:hypothetical protein
LISFTVRGGDFPADTIGQYDERGQYFSLPPLFMTLDQIQYTAPATTETLQRMGGEERFGEVGILSRVRADCKLSEHLFVVSFLCGKALLGSTDWRTREFITKTKPLPQDGAALDD